MLQSGAIDCIILVQKTVKTFLMSLEESTFKIVEDVYILCFNLIGVYCIKPIYSVQLVNE